jgi:hypothetical protein
MGQLVLHISKFQATRAMHCTENERHIFRTYILKIFFITEGNIKYILAAEKNHI